MSKGRIIYVGLAAAALVALYLIRPAGDPNPGPHMIIRALLSV